MPKYTIELDTDNKKISFQKNDKEVVYSEFSISNYVYQTSMGPKTDECSLTYTVKEDDGEVTNKRISMYGVEASAKVKASTSSTKDAKNLVANLRKR